MASDQAAGGFPEGYVRVGAIVLCAHVLAFLAVVAHVGFALRGLTDTTVSTDSVLWTAAIAAWVVSLLGIAAELVSGFYERRIWTYGSVLLAGITGVGFVHLAYTSGSEQIFTDVVLFMRYSADLVIDGQNPYTQSMLGALERYASLNSLPGITRRIDGSRVENLSYPAGSFLVFVPQRLLGLSNISLTVVVFFVLTLLFLVRETPAWMFMLGVVALFYNEYLLSNAAFGNIDFVWIFPLLLGMHYWNRGHLVRAAFAVGLSFTVKPIPWLVGPYVAIWLWKDPEWFGKTRVQAIGQSLAAGFAAFLLPNLPFILDAPRAWLFDVFSAAGSRVAFQTRGSGLAAYTYHSLIPIPKIGFRIVVVAVLLGTMALYYRRFERVKWVAWLMPCFVLWFNDRALFNYFVTFAPVAYYAVLLNRGVVEPRPLVPVARVWESIGGRLSRAEEVDAQ